MKKTMIASMLLLGFVLTTGYSCGPAPCESSVDCPQTLTCNLTLKLCSFSGKGSTCTAGDKATCYSGEASTLGFQPCVAGKQVCDKNGSWGHCVGEVLPRKEICNGVDSNCDGLVDNDCRSECSGNRVEGCNVPGEKGFCGKGLRTCKGGLWGECLANKPEKEKCDDQIDNDCDGVTDEDCKVPSCEENKSRSCVVATSSTESRCRDGKQVCTQGEWTKCKPVFVRGPEVCDALDNDCDGLIDNITLSCYTADAKTEGVGLCQTGKKVCTKGQWSACLNEVTPTKEICDKQDNDCNGAIDDGCGTSGSLRVVSPPYGEAGAKVVFSVHGTGFLSGAVIVFDGRSIPSKRLRRDEINADPYLDLAGVLPGMYDVWVRQPDGKETNKMTFTVKP